MALKHLVVCALDLVDDYVLRHRFPRLCAWLGASSWWAPHYTCPSCGVQVSDGFKKHTCLVDD